MLYLDTDVTPQCNLDYVLDASDGPEATLLENVVLAGKMEPARCGTEQIEEDRRGQKRIKENRRG